MCGASPSNSWHVPAGAFNGSTPERAASRQLSRFFTHAAAWVVLDQLEAVSGGTGERASSRPLSPPPPGLEAAEEAAEALAADREALANHLQSVPLQDGDTWLAQLSEVTPRVALRVAETRLAYATDSFEWDSLRRLAGEELAAGNASFRASWLRRAVESGAAGFALPGLGGGKKGKPQCVVCLGIGSKPCGQCEGTGVMAEERFGVPAGAPCWLCEGTKRTMCGSCVDMSDTF